MSFIGLRVGASGLSVAQRALETSAHNVANAGTEGYTRQRVELSTRSPIAAHRGPFGPGSTGQGVAVDAVTRAHDALLATNHRETASQMASWDVRSSFYAQAERVLGPLEGGTAGALSDFWNSWEALSQTPESMTGRDQVLDAGRRLSQSINDAHRRVVTMQSDVVADMRSTVTELNQIAAEVADLNGQIKVARTRGEPNDLLDRRDQALAELAKLSGAQTYIESDGDARVTVGNIPLVDGERSDALVVSGTPPTLLWERSGTAVAAGGELGSLSELASTGAQEILDRLDQLAVELRDVVNAVHEIGFGLDGADGQSFFEGSGADNLSLAAGLTNRTVAASESGAAADGNHALTLGALRSAPGASGQTVTELVNGMQGFLGLEAAHAANQLEMTTLVVDDVAASLARAGGVSVDEELTDMLRFQRAYDASSRVITVIDEMLDRLINRTGATR